MHSETKTTEAGPAAALAAREFGQVVLVLQGGGALGAYQVGVYQALHEAGIEPDWVIGTSIGAINGAIIAGNPPEKRLERLNAFWHSVEQTGSADCTGWNPWLTSFVANAATVTSGVKGFFSPNPGALLSLHAAVGPERAAFYSTKPLGATLAQLIDFDYINARHSRLTLGAVNVKSGGMHYFDNRNAALDARHVMASGALPPAFPAVDIDGDLFWDGGIYSNTPIEVVLDDKPRRNSLIFAANMWHSSGPAPESIWQVLGRQKDIQFASREKSHVQRQQQIHRLRHIIRDLGRCLPAAQRDDPAVKKLLGYGCATIMHVVPLLAPRIDTEDHMKDIDFTAAGIRARRNAGYEATTRALRLAPWRGEVDAMDGVKIGRAHV